MPGGDPRPDILRGCSTVSLPTAGVGICLRRGGGAISSQVSSPGRLGGVNVVPTSSAGRVLDAAAALLGICQERTYDGEPAVKLESAAYAGRASAWDLEFLNDGGCEILSTRAILSEAHRRVSAGERPGDVAASVQYNLARGIAAMAVRAAGERGIPRVALSGGVAYNRAIRETIIGEVRAAGLEVVMNREYPLGDGCISFGQVVWGGSVE